MSPSQPNVTYSASYVPTTLPNTGFAPLSIESVTLSLVLLIAAGVFILPYVRKTFAALIG